MISVEDITGKYRGTEEVVDPTTGEKRTRDVMNVEEVVNRLVATMVTREQNEGKEFGVMVMAEGLAEYLPMTYLQGVARDEHGHIAVSQLNLCQLFSKLISDKYTEVTGNRRKITGLQIGYEARCAVPHAFDVMLGSQLGVGAYRALVEERLNGVMVSVSGQLESELCPVRETGRSGNAGHHGPLRAAQLRFPPAGPVSGNVRQRVSVPRVVSPRQRPAAKTVCPRPSGFRFSR